MIVLIFILKLDFLPAGRQVCFFYIMTKDKEDLCRIETKSVNTIRSPTENLTLSLERWLEENTSRRRRELTFRLEQCNAKAVKNDKRAWKLAFLPSRFNCRR